MKALVLSVVLIAGISLCTSAQTVRHTTKDAGKSATVGAAHGKKKGWYKSPNSNSNTIYRNTDYDRNRTYNQPSGRKGKRS